MLQQGVDVGRACRGVRLLGLALAVALGVPTVAVGQAIDDGLMVPKKTLFTGVVFGHDQWSEYWEGTLKRDNANVGTLTTKTVTWMATYGLMDRLNVLAVLPFVSTNASGGTLQPQSNLQDFTVAAKLRLLESGAADHGARAYAVAVYGVPVSDYVADLLPLSIGLHAQRFSGRGTFSYLTRPGLFADATGAYTWRGHVTLDRPAYYTDGQLFLNDQVAMPDVFDYTVRAGYMRGRWMIPLSFSQQITRGGGDIRRQDMPFVSNKMDFSRLDAMVMYTLPTPANLALRLDASRVLTGRNVGQSTTITAGAMYTIRF